MEATERTRRIRFDAFDVDMRAGEVRKHGIRLKLHRQPFQVLSLLLEHPGDVVTREELRQKLWPGDTFVDFDTGLNSAVKKLRDALCDSADAPPLHRDSATPGIPFHRSGAKWRFVCRSVADRVARCCSSAVKSK
jgi:DNA-binding response OmpR family regulator